MTLKHPLRLFNKLKNWNIDKVDQMNIISGIAKGIRLEVPKGLSVRPTGAMARKSIFDSVGNWNGLLVVDLFAGSGALGLEAASRGADTVYFSESSSLHCQILKRNIARVKNAGVEAELNVLRSDSLKFYRHLPEVKEQIDVLFADPPYKDTAEVTRILFNDIDFAKWAKKSLFILESPGEASRRPVIADFEYWKIKQIKSKGQSTFYYMQPTV